jgi:CRISPR system Cascade subunit CasD
VTAPAGDAYLLLWLEGPLQAWGHDSKFGRRDSLDFPTKSGVLGMICCARGEGGMEREWLGDWADQDMQVIAFARTSADGTGLLRQPLLRDFHMVGSGYDDQNPWAKLLIPKTSEGKKAVGGGTKMTYRYYLQDAAFAVILQAPEKWVSDTRKALENPVWDLFLGRKNCVPTEFIFQGEFNGAHQAVEKARALAQEKGRKVAFRVVQGALEGEVLTLNDVPVQFGPHKKYRDRQVTVQPGE